MTFVDAGLEPDRMFWYRLELESRSGEIARSWSIGIRTGMPHDSTVLEPPITMRPGPIEVRYALGSARLDVQLAVFDVRGRVVRQLAEGPHAAGRFVRTWDRTDDAGHPVAHGVYLMQLTAGADRVTRKVVLTTP